MKPATFLQKVGPYGTVGLLAAAVHTEILLLIPVDLTQPGQPDRFSHGLFHRLCGPFLNDRP